VRLELAAPLDEGTAQIELSFTGALRDDLRGLYFARSGKRKYAFSQLEAADARRFFPCFDEPAFKARFSIAVETASGHSVISNGKPIARARAGKGKQRVRFATTPLLSTYLVALAVGELSASRAVRAGKTAIRVWHSPEQRPLTRYALIAARECLLRLERYFGVPYPYDKLDLVAVPDFSAGAMENAGAVFFRETLLLIDERRATLPEKKRAAEVICHELAHMWYGNLVTMRWWDDLWLNEAFATWMAFQIVDDWQPALRMWNDFGHARNSALALDALGNTHPVYTEVHSAADATQNFDLITYEKGASVIRMLERYLGAERFRAGVRDYIARHREGNATAADLWRALERHAGKAVAEVVRPWIEREGFPLLRVRGRGKRALEIEQERFSAHGADKAAHAAPWPVPLVLKLGGSGKPSFVRALVATRKARVALPPKVRFAYAYANADEGGFFRPLHVAAVGKDLAAHAGALDAVERLGLVTHTWALVHAGYAPLPAFLDLLPALRDERDPDVLSALRGPLFHVLDSVAPWAGATAAAELRAYVARVFGPALASLGLRARRGEDEHEKLRRAELMGLLALLAEDAGTLAAIEELLPGYLRAPSAVEANLAGPIVTAGARLGDAKRHARYVAASLRASTPQEQRRFRMALAEFRDPACVDATLRLCLDARIPTQDVALLLARLFENPKARDAAFDFLRAHWAELERRMPASLASRVIDAAPLLRTEAHRRALAAFFAQHPVPAAARALRQADERFRLDRALRERSAGLLDRWLAQVR
jgi:puromycin-sensitive aminopeptidase